MQQIHSPEILLEYTCLIAQLYGSNPAHLGWRHGQGELKPSIRMGKTPDSSDFQRGVKIFVKDKSNLNNHSDQPRYGEEHLCA